MSAVLGLLAGVGLLLAASPFLWPAGFAPRATRQPGAAAAWRGRLALAGLPQASLPLLAVGSVLVGIALGALLFALLPVVPLAVVTAVVGMLLPLAAVNWRARAAQRATRVLWPDVVDHLVSAVRSGVPLPDGLSTLARAGPPATRAAFASFEADYRATGNFSSCVDRLKIALADPVADRILETLRMSRDVGGTELVSVLRNLSAYLRQEAAIRSEVEARQSWTLNAARLGVAAPWVVLLLLSTRPEAAAAYNSTAGVMLIVAGLGVTIVAYRIMVGLGRLPEERRWFQ
ncbi:MAG: type II secretion system F family protein [Microbacteriaceae bacterium]